MSKFAVRTNLLIGVGILFVGIAVGAIFWQTRYNPIPQLAYSASQKSHTEPFPDVDMSVLDDRQQKIVTLLRQEYDAQNPGTKYSEGAKEPWCANFVSWIMRETGHPLSNPNSGSWRIPGTYTLREYYESKSKFMAADSGYQPKVGDIMLYDNPSPFGQHTNIIISTDQGVITTIGGNENGKIRVVKHTIPDKEGFIGYGII